MGVGVHVWLSGWVVRCGCGVVWVGKWLGGLVCGLMWVWVWVCISGWVWEMGWVGVGVGGQVA